MLVVMATMVVVVMMAFLMTMVVAMALMAEYVLVVAVLWEDKVLISSSLYTFFYSLLW